MVLTGLALVSPARPNPAAAPLFCPRFQGVRLARFAERSQKIRIIRDDNLVILWRSLHLLPDAERFAIEFGSSGQVPTRVINHGEIAIGLRYVGVSLWIGLAPNSKSALLRHLRFFETAFRPWSVRSSG